MTASVPASVRFGPVRHSLLVACRRRSARPLPIAFGLLYPEFGLPALQVGDPLALLQVARHLGCVLLQLPAGSLRPILFCSDRDLRPLGGLAPRLVLDGLQPCSVRSLVLAKRRHAGRPPAQTGGSIPTAGAWIREPALLHLRRTDHLLR